MLSTFEKYCHSVLAVSSKTILSNSVRAVMHSSAKTRLHIDSRVLCYPPLQTRD